ncbi:MAG TPA: nitronate monooxygenase [Gemmataceae bacterium]|nr:nitronate monooxygenase [Gemmataceae bacterium]
MEPSDIIVLTPAWAADPAVAIAACRAGARGTLDLEFISDRTAVEKLARFAPAGFGLKIGLTTDLACVGGAKPAWVVLPANHPDLNALAARFRTAGAEVLVEVVSMSEAACGLAVNPDGIILKGHEAGGRVGADTSFVLVQKFCHAGHKVPFWVRGGVGPNTAAACLAAGAHGVVLDSQVLLARESPLTDAQRRKLAGMDGGETAVLGARLGEAFRCYSRADSAAFQELQRDEDRAADSTAWRAAILSRLGASPLPHRSVGGEVGVASTPGEGE